MKLEDAKADIEIISKLKGKKILLKGNHDYWWSTISKVRNILPANMYAIQNDCLEIGDYIFCGSRGWIVDTAKMTSVNDKKILDRELIRLEMSLQSATQKLTDGKKIICLMHFPPFDIERHRRKRLRPSVIDARHHISPIVDMFKHPFQRIGIEYHIRVEPHNEICFIEQGLFCYLVPAGINQRTEVEPDRNLCVLDSIRR